MANFPALTRTVGRTIDPDGEIEDVVIRSPQTSGYEQTRPRSTRARRNWGISYPALSNTDVSTLKTFEITTLRNGADSFNWTHPVSGTVYVLRLASPINYRRMNKDHTAVAIKMREV